MKRSHSRARAKLAPETFWKRLDRVLARHEKRIEENTRRILDEVIGEEARAYMLNHFREHPYS